MIKDWDFEKAKRERRMASWMGEEFTAFASLSNPLRYGSVCMFWFLKTKKEHFEETNNMEANAGMVAGSHKRNELVRIRHDSDSGVSDFSTYPFPIFTPFLV